MFTGSDSGVSGGGEGAKKREDVREGGGTAGEGGEVKGGEEERVEKVGEKREPEAVNYSVELTSDQLTLLLQSLESNLTRIRYNVHNYISACTYSICALDHCYLQSREL